MRYIIAEKTLANAHGFNPFSHRTSGNNILLNEKEIIFSPCLQGSLEERAKTINGTIYESSQIKQIINEGGWND